MINISPDYATAKHWFEQMREARVAPDDVTYSTLINISPDYATAKHWFEQMREARVAPNMVTLTTIAKHVTSFAEADELTGLILASECQIGYGYFAKIYSIVARELTAPQLLSWRAKQGHKSPSALDAAISRYRRDEKIEDALRVALAFPYLPASRKLFRDRNDAAVAYYSKCLADGFEPYNANYALGYCFFEACDYDPARALFGAALEDAPSGPRCKDIKGRLEEIRERSRAA
jgi:tetratricopeptide (TPR) repeat protein